MAKKSIGNKPYPALEHISVPDSWEQVAGGRRLQTALQDTLNEMLRGAFGYYGIALGPLSEAFCMTESPVRNWFHVDHREKKGNLQAEYRSLPLQSDSVDVVLIPHLLDFVARPHDILREVERIVIPEGKVLITGINPFSVYGAHWLGRKLLRREVLARRLIGLARLKDWLMLLGFSVDDNLGIDHYNPLREESSFNRFGKPLLAHISSHYVLEARKQVSTLTPMRPSWQTNSKLVPARFAEPSIRHLVDRELNRVFE